MRIVVRRVLAAIAAGAAAIPVSIELADGKVPVFGYEFSDPNAPNLLSIPGVTPGASHGAELPCLFNFPSQTAQLTPAQQALSRTMITYWVGADPPTRQPRATPVDP